MLYNIFIAAFRGGPRPVAASRVKYIILLLLLCCAPASAKYSNRGRPTEWTRLVVVAPMIIDNPINRIIVRKAPTACGSTRQTPVHRRHRVILYYFIGENGSPHQLSTITAQRSVVRLTARSGDIRMYYITTISYYPK